MADCQTDSGIRAASGKPERPQWMQRFFGYVWQLGGHAMVLAVVMPEAEDLN